MAAILSGLVRVFLISLCLSVSVSVCLSLSLSLARAFRLLFFLSQIFKSRKRDHYYEPVISVIHRLMPAGRPAWHRLPEPDVC